MNLEARWVWRGYFDFSKQDIRRTTTQEIRDTLCERLGMPKRALRIARYPVGAAWAHSYWWRQGTLDYAEAQFFMRVAHEYPVLSMGVSVEKGLEAAEHLPPGKRASRTMNRRRWNWPRLLRIAPTLFKSAVPRVGAALGRPLSVRIDTTRSFTKGGNPRERWTYTHVDGAWFERHRGHAKAEGIASLLRELDGRREWWVNVYIGCDLAPGEVEGKSPAEVADLLIAFKGIRQELRW